MDKLQSIDEYIEAVKSLKALELEKQSLQSKIGR